MAVSIPTAIDPNTIDPDDKDRATVGTVSAGIKVAGNIPLTDSASQYTVNTGNTGGKIINFDLSNGSSSSAISYDVSSETKLLVCSWQFNAPNRIQIDTIANGGLQLRLVTGSGTSNYRTFYIAGQDTNAGKYQPGVAPFVIDLNATADLAEDPADTGTYDNTDVQAYGWVASSVSMSGGSSHLSYLQRLHIFDTDLDGADIVKFTSTSDFDDIVTGVLGTSIGTAIGNWVSKAGSTILIPVAFQIGDSSTATNFNDNGATIITPSNADSSDPRYRYTTQALRVYVRLRNNAADDVVMSGTYVWGVASPWDMDFDNLASVSLDGATFSGMGNFTIGVSVTTGSSTFNLNSGSNLISNGANIDNVTVNGDADIQGSTVTTFTGLNITGALDFDTAGTYTLVNCTVNEVTNSSGGNVTIVNDGSIITTNTGPNITIEIAGLTLNFTNLTSANVQILDNLGAVEDRVTGQTGTYIYTIPDGSTGTWSYCINREGYDPILGTFDGSGTSDLTINGTQTQKVQPDGSPMYQATSSIFLTVVPVADGSRMNERIADGSVRAQELFDETEVALMTQDGMSYLMNGGGEVSIALLPTGTFVFMGTNVRLIRDNAGDSNATVNAFVQSTDGIVIDDTNGDIQFVTVTEAQQLIEYGGSVIIDPISGSNQSSYPYGTKLLPVDSWSNAKVIADTYGIRNIQIVGVVTLDADIEGYVVKGGNITDTVIKNGFSVAGSTFRQINIGGASNGAHACKTCNMLDGITGISGSFITCSFSGTLTLENSASVLLSRCVSNVPGSSSPEIIHGTNTQLSLRSYNGGLTLSNSTAGCNTTLEYNAGKCTLDASNTGGNISIRGIPDDALTDNSSGATVDLTPMLRGLSVRPSVSV